MKGIDRKQIKRILDKIEADLSEKPDQYPELKGKFTGLRKFRVGDYRIIFTIKDKQDELYWNDSGHKGNTFTDPFQIIYGKDKE
jgi:mRNA-degrading endonuclease RelE of RelBE toxin-antitoxin system